MLAVSEREIAAFLLICVSTLGYAFSWRLARRLSPNMARGDRWKSKVVRPPRDKRAARRAKYSHSPGELPPCRHGARCYDMSPHHRSRYSHPDPVLWQKSDVNKWPRTWTDLPSGESHAVEEGFQGGKLSHLTGSFLYNYQSWTALRKGEDKHHVWAIRRLERCSRMQTHPPPSGGSAPQMVGECGVLADIHPYDVYLMRKKLTPNDWLTHDFFFECFISACKQLGQDTTAFEQPGRLHEWFDCRSNVDWRQQTNTVMHTRGGYPYTEPNGFYGFAVNVLGKYDNGDNSWMKADGRPEEWAIAYHGTKVDGFAQILQNGFRAGGGQAYKNSKCVKTGRTVGVGVYCTPGLKTAAAYGGCGHMFDGHQIIFVMQCRVRPSAIKHAHDYLTNPEAYWVINDPRDIRPYRVLIMKKN